MINILHTKAWIGIQTDPHIHSQSIELMNDILINMVDEYTYSTFCNHFLQGTFPARIIAYFTSRLSILDKFIAEKLKQSLQAKGVWKDHMYEIEPLEELFKQGVPVIVDLSDPMLKAEFASVLFDIVLKIFVRAQPQPLDGEIRNKVGKIVVLDEANKVC